MRNIAGACIQNLYYLSNNFIKQIPNIITCGNLVCGCMGILAATHHQLQWAVYFIIIASLLDFFDGFLARKLNSNSTIGKDLDSLADGVTFGVLPGFIIFELMNSNYVFTTNVFSQSHPLSFFAFLIPVFSIVRLAKFNNDPRQTDSFIGLPTPACTLFVASLVYIQHDAHTNFSFGLFHSPPVFSGLMKSEPNIYAFVTLIAILSFLLVCELPLFALKFKSFALKDNVLRYFFLLCGLILLIKFNFAAFAYIIPLYILISVFAHKFSKA